MKRTLGRHLAAYNGAILQSLDAVTWKPIRSTGGRGQGFAYLDAKPAHSRRYRDRRSRRQGHQPIPNNLFGRTYNKTFWGKLMWDVTKSFRIALEVTHRKTDTRSQPICPTKHGVFIRSSSGPSFRILARYSGSAKG